MRMCRSRGWIELWKSIILGGVQLFRISHEIVESTLCFGFLFLILLPIKFAAESEILGALELMFMQIVIWDDDGKFEVKRQRI